MRNTTAAAIVIGNEILSGKVLESNAAFLAKELRALGVSLERILTIPDDIPTIADTVRDYAGKYDVVFTSGGVGPTHDDLTMEGIALGLGRPVVVDAVLVEKIRQFGDGEMTPPKLKMAQVPQGAEPIFEGDLAFPVVRVDNIYILPGIPELFREKFLAIRKRFAVDPFHLRVVFLRLPESAIAAQLDATLAAFPDLMLGSYPKWSDSEYRVRVTLESKNEDYLARAFDHLLASLPADAVVRTE